MILLLLFALVAGAGTALSPCVLPILPAILSAGATGGRRRPLGVVVGLALSFAFAVTALALVIDALGLPDDLLRWIAIVVLVGFGLLLAIPRAADRLEASISRLVPAPKRAGSGDGFGSGLLLGASLGILYLPCAGPILAGVVVGAASQDFTAGRLAVALAYAAGSAAVLYAVMMGGRRVSERVKPWRAQVQAGMGAVMCLVALAMAADLDREFQDAIAEHLPGFLVNPTESLEETDAIADDLASVRGGNEAGTVGSEAAADGAEDEDGLVAGQAADLPDYGAAPDFELTGEWFNTDGAELSVSELTGDADGVVLIDFWTYTCVNCIRTLPQVRSWASEYEDDGLTVVGVHTPEFAFEREASNVEGAIEDFSIDYPVVQDNDYGTWSAYGNQYWPAKYLIDADGHVRFAHFGEGAYEQTEAAIRALLAEAGDGDLGEGAQARTERADPGVRTPEIYLGSARAEGFTEAPENGRRSYSATPAAELAENELSLGGSWRVTDEEATAGEDATLALRFSSRRVFLVLGAENGPARVRLKLDGKPITARVAGDDVKGSAATVEGQRLYRLVDLPRAGEHTLELDLAAGVSGYAFTFG